MHNGDGARLRANDVTKTTRVTLQDGAAALPEFAVPHGNAPTAAT